MLVGAAALHRVRTKIMQGVLLKEEWSGWAGWEERYLVLEPGVLKVFASEAAAAGGSVLDSVHPLPMASRWHGGVYVSVRAIPPGYGWRVGGRADGAPGVNTVTGRGLSVALAELLHVMCDAVRPRAVYR